MCLAHAAHTDNLLASMHPKLVAAHLQRLCHQFLSQTYDTSHQTPASL